MKQEDKINIYNFSYYSIYNIQKYDVIKQNIVYLNRIFVKGMYFLSFGKNIDKNIDKTISKNLSSKYCQKHFDYFK